VAFLVDDTLAVDRQVAVILANPVLGKALGAAPAQGLDKQARMWAIGKRVPLPQLVKRVAQVQTIGWMMAEPQELKQPEPAVFHRIDNINSLLDLVFGNFDR
jgi:hypothetical protein